VGGGREGGRERGREEEGEESVVVRDRYLRQKKEGRREEGGEGGRCGLASSDSRLLYG